MQRQGDNKDFEEKLAERLFADEDKSRKDIKTADVVDDAFTTEVRLSFVVPRLVFGKDVMFMLKVRVKKYMAIIDVFFQVRYNIGLHTYKCVHTCLHIAVVTYPWLSCPT